MSDSTLDKTGLSALSQVGSTPSHISEASTVVNEEKDPIRQTSKIETNRRLSTSLLSIVVEKLPPPPEEATPSETNVQVQVHKTDLTSPTADLSTLQARI